MIWCGDIEIPIKALDDEISLHLNEVFIRESGPDQSLNVHDAWLMTVLFVGLACQQNTGESHKVKVVPQLLVAKDFHLIEPIGFSLFFVQPSFEIHTRNVRGLQLKAEPYSTFENLYNSLLSNRVLDKIEIKLRIITVLVILIIVTFDWA